MERYKIQMKALKKQRGKINNTPFSPSNGTTVYVMDSIGMGEKMVTEIWLTQNRNGRKVIKSLVCPVCKNIMEWDEHWEAFQCMKHGTKAIYEIVES